MLDPNEGCCFIRVGLFVCLSFCESVIKTLKRSKSISNVKRVALIEL